MAQEKNKSPSGKKLSTRIRARKSSASKRSVIKKSAAAKGKPKKKKKSPKKSLGTCFVLMPFKEPFDTYYATIIKPAVVASRLEPLRGDSLFRPSPIMGDIWEMIQNAKVLVAELTEKNANVFYELGLGHAIGKPIVLISETIDDVPFDLQPLRVIIYNKDDPAWGNKLRNDITASLEETITDPSNAVPPMFRKKVKSQAPEEAGMLERLSALERRFETLRADDSSTSSLRVGPPIFKETDFKREVSVVASRSSAAAVTRRALIGGVSRSAIRRVLRQTVPHGEAEPVLKMAMQTTLFGHDT